MTNELIEWAVAAIMHEGETILGDHYVICQVEDRVLVAVIDGVGHGPEASAASHAAAAVLEAHPEQPLLGLFKECHSALHSTRGVVMTLAMVDGGRNRLAWVGIGNVEGRLLRADKTASHPEETLLLRSGVVGHEMPSTLTISSLQLFRGDVLILATDGIRYEFASKLHISPSAHQIANNILAKHGKGTDDALALVAKYRGGDSSQIE